MYSMFLFNLMTKRFEWPKAHNKFHIIINISYIVISWLKHLAESDILVRFVMSQ